MGGREGEEKNTPLSAMAWALNTRRMGELGKGKGEKGEFVRGYTLLPIDRKWKERKSSKKKKGEKTLNRQQLFSSYS